MEQIRNDVCFHDLPVKLVGNGGGFAYGVMGASHHAIDDYGILLSLLNMRVFIPAFDSDVPPIVKKIITLDHPSYLRLGRDEKPKELEIPEYSPWRQVLQGNGSTLLITGPLVGGIIAVLVNLPEAKRPSVWVLSELPIEEKTIPPRFVEDLQKSGHLIVAEEHVAHGGVGEAISRCLLLEGKPPRRFSHYFAQGYLSGYYGSQQFHRNECGITAENILKELDNGISRG